MSFFEQFDGPVDGSAENSNSQPIDVFPGGTRVVYAIEEAKKVANDGENANVNRDGNRYYEFKCKILDGDFKGRVFFLKIKCFSADPKKNAKEANRLMRLYLLAKNTDAGIVPPIEEPDNAALMPLVNKPMGATLETFEMLTENDNKYIAGNWVSELLDPRAEGFTCVTGDKPLKGEAALRAEAGQPAAAQSSQPASAAASDGPAWP